MLTFGEFISVISLCIACFSLGYRIGRDKSVGFPGNLRILTFLTSKLISGEEMIYLITDYEREYSEFLYYRPC